MEAPKTTTGTRMATPRAPIPVTVSTLKHTLGGVAGGIPLGEGGGLGTQSARPYVVWDVP